MVARRRDRVKIGITCYPTYGGSGVVATELGIALAARGHEVHFITYQMPFRLPVFLPRVYFHEVDVGRYPLFQHPPYDLAPPLRAPSRLGAGAGIAKEMRRKEGRDITVITTLHGTDITIVGQDHSFHAITKFSIEKSDRITAVSAFLKEETVRAFGCEDCDVEVIPNFVDPAVYDRSRHEPSLRRQIGED